MDYDTFRTLWHEALTQAGLVIYPLRPAETIDVQRMSREYKIYLPLDQKDQPRPFYVSVELSWRWDALQSARAATTEEDMVMELLGEDEYDRETERPWLRIDVILHANLEANAQTPMPEADVWQRWARTVMRDLEAVMPPDLRERQEETDASLFWQGNPAIRLRCDLDGQLAFRGVELPSWHGIELPRQWDNPERAWNERGPEPQLTDLCGWVAERLRVWAASLRHLIV